MSDALQFFAVLLGAMVLLTVLLSWLVSRASKREQDEALYMTYTAMVRELRTWGLILVIVNRQIEVL